MKPNVHYVDSGSQVEMRDRAVQSLDGLSQVEASEHLAQSLLHHVRLLDRHIFQASSVSPTAEADMGEALAHLHLLMSSKESLVTASQLVTGMFFYD